MYVLVILLPYRGNHLRDMARDLILAVAIMDPLDFKQQGTYFILRARAVPYEYANLPQNAAIGV